jgi:hypothetical protein
MLLPALRGDNGCAGTLGTRGRTHRRCTMDVASRLRSLGHGKYEAAFRENEINERGPAEPNAEALR